MFFLLYIMFCLFIVYSFIFIIGGFIHLLWIIGGFIHLLWIYSFISCFGGWGKCILHTFGQVMAWYELLASWIMMTESLRPGRSNDWPSVKSMAKCKTAVTPLLMQWSYCSLALSHGSLLDSWHWQWYRYRGGMHLWLNSLWPSVSIISFESCTVIIVKVTC